MARRGTWHGVQCHAMPRFRVNVARHGAWRATRGAEIFTRATPGPKKTGGAITAPCMFATVHVFVLREQGSNDYD